jgi:hypothetical protein
VDLLVKMTFGIYGCIGSKLPLEYMDLLVQNDLRNIWMYWFKMTLGICGCIGSKRTSRIYGCIGSKWPLKYMDLLVQNDL